MISCPPAFYKQCIGRLKASKSDLSCSTKPSKLNLTFALILTPHRDHPFKP